MAVVRKRNRILILLCTLVLVVTGVLGQDSKRINASDPVSWKRYTITGEEFSVILPSMPEMLTTKENERLGRHLRTRLDGVQYGIDVFENPTGQSLEDFIAEYNTDSRSKLTTGRDIVVNNVSGKEYSTSGPPPAIVQFFIMERRLLRFIALGGNAENAAVHHFFSSIIIGKTADAIKVSEGPGMPLELDTGERIYKGGEVDRKVRLVSKPPPAYPEEARRAGFSKTVVLQAIFSKSGKVDEIKVLTPGHHLLNEACIAAAQQITFVPAIKDGKNVSMYMTLEYNFY
jgi:TonB family protein